MTTNEPLESVKVLVSKITVTISRIEGNYALKQRYWNKMQSASEANDNFVLVAILREVRRIARRQVEMAPAKEKWEEAKASAIALVRAENAQGHKGQIMFDKALKREFEAVLYKVSNYAAGLQSLAGLMTDLEELIFSVQNYVWPGKWCLVCGMPLVGNMQVCPGCVKVVEAKASRDRRDYDVPSAHVVKVKKGSAARRSKGPKPAPKPAAPVSAEEPKKEKKKGKAAAKQ